MSTCIGPYRTSTLIGYILAWLESVLNQASIPSRKCPHTSFSQHKASFFVGRLGIEPRFTASKAAVLPLDDLPILSGNLFFDFLFTFRCLVIPFPEKRFVFVLISLFVN